MCTRKRAHGSGGFTLIELTVVLAVLVTLALVLTPSITNFINESRIARTRHDAQILGAAVVQFYKDNGFFPRWDTAGAAGGPGVLADEVDVLIGPGNTPTQAVADDWTTGTTDTIANQLLANTPGYTPKNATAAYGWNGPYLSNSISADAWNNRYMINVRHIDTTQGTQTSAGTPKQAVWVISAGSNGIIETPYDQNMTTAAIGGDDIGVRIQ
jgi:prepilin-type N-terminal cleavage/methylation domain-containing protein